MSESLAIIHWQQRRDSRCLDLPPRCRRAEWRGFSREKRRWMSERSRRRSEFSAAREKPRSEGNPGPRSGPGSRQSGVFLGYFFARAKKYLAARWRVSAWQYAGRSYRKHQVTNQDQPPVEPPYSLIEDSNPGTSGARHAKGATRAPLLNLAEREGLRRRSRRPAGRLRSASAFRRRYAPPVEPPCLSIEVSNPGTSGARHAKGATRAPLLNLAEREGFEPSIRGYRIHTFQACAFDRSATSPFSATAGRPQSAES